MDMYKKALEKFGMGDPKPTVIVGSHSDMVQTPAQQISTSRKEVRNVVKTVLGANVCYNKACGSHLEADCVGCLILKVPSKINCSEFVGLE